MIEAEKKGSPWPWILVPVGAVGLFFVLRECRQNLPPANIAPEATVAEPAITPTEAASAATGSPADPVPTAQ